MSYSLSTKWNIGRHESPESLVNEVKDLGISVLEISCDTPESFLNGYQTMVDRGEIGISSVHNFCPAPLGRRSDGDAYLLSSLDDGERELAVRYTVLTMENAAKLKAKVVVVHLGRVEIDETTACMKRLICEGVLTPYQRVQDITKARLARSQKELAHLDAVFRSLDELIPVAERFGLVLGLENRLRYRQIPLAWELGRIFERFDGAPLGYWHDVGHAEFLDRLGFIKQGELLGLFGDRLIGMHLHDIRTFTDHRAPGTGTTNFAPLTAYLRDDVLRVLELAAEVDTSDVIKGIDHLQRLGF